MKLCRKCPAENGRERWRAFSTHRLPNTYSDVINIGLPFGEVGRGPLIEVDDMAFGISLLVVEGDAEVVKVIGDDMVAGGVFLPLTVEVGGDDEGICCLVFGFDMVYLALFATSFEMGFHDGRKCPDNTDGRCLGIVGYAKQELR